MKIALCFSQFGPYHRARAADLRRLAGPGNLVCVQIAADTRTYAWKSTIENDRDLITLLPGNEEDAGFFGVFRAAWILWRRERPAVALLPSYSPASSLALFLSAKLSGVKCIMMNESHAGTERARGIKRWIKKRLVALFDGALVGGAPQVRHFTNLGMNPETIFTGYDAIDNEYFAREAARVRSDRDGWRERLGLPDRYILSLGRMVEKKNLGCLINAYTELSTRFGAEAPALVFVGSGDQEPNLREQCVRLGLNVVDASSCAVSPRASGQGTEGRRQGTGDRGQGTGDRGQGTGDRGQGAGGGGEWAEGRGQKSEDRSQRSDPSDISFSSPTSDLRPLISDLQSPISDLQSPISDLRSPTSDLRPPTPDSGPLHPGTVFFYGFRQIEENPAFYALAECFVLPSLYEEWGLVVNEAMACGLPLLVSKTVGSAEDLVLPDINGWQFDPKSHEDLANMLVALAENSVLRRRFGDGSLQIISKWGCDNFASKADQICKLVSQ